MLKENTVIFPFGVIQETQKTYPRLFFSIRDFDRNLLFFTLRSIFWKNNGNNVYKTKIK
jgi:hypothetical protein